MYTIYKLLTEFSRNDIPEHIIEWSLDFLNGHGIDSSLKLVSNTTVVEAGTPQGTVSDALVRLHNLLYTGLCCN